MSRKKASKELSLEEMVGLAKKVDNWEKETSSESDPDYGHLSSTTKFSSILDDNIDIYVKEKLYSMSSDDYTVCVEGKDLVLGKECQKPSGEVECLFHEIEKSYNHMKRKEEQKSRRKELQNRKKELEKARSLL